jgi:hypothetical protein
MLKTTRHSKNTSETLKIHNQLNGHNKKWHNLIKKGERWRKSAIQKHPLRQRNILVQKSTDAVVSHRPATKVNNNEQ